MDDLILLIAISIHALRVEGDHVFCCGGIRRIEISIHALRVEGDFKMTAGGLFHADFYPRPPGGGRRFGYSSSQIEILFLSTPSGWRATAKFVIKSPAILDFYPRPPGGGRRRCVGVHLRDLLISIHALRVEGDREVVTLKEHYKKFLSTPSGWRATAKTDKVFICFCAKGRRICLFKTRKEKICR